MSQPVSLQVRLEKRLPEFSLRAEFTAQSGEPVAVLGASGAGKTTLLRCVAGLERPDAGAIALSGQPLFDSARRLELPARQRNIGLLFQHGALFPHLTVAENIAFGLHGWTVDDKRSRLSELLAQFHLAALAGRAPQTLSGGERQRAALARALAPRPAALLLDEPLTALDPPLRAEMENVLALLFAVYRGPVLFVTHQLEEAYRLCPRILVLDRGEIAADGDRETLFRHPPTVAVARLTGCKNFSRAETAAPGTIRALDWGCELQIVQPPAGESFQVAIRAHHLKVSARASGGVNEFSVWPAAHRDGPFRVTLFLKLHGPAAGPEDYQLQTELTREAFTELWSQPPPWQIRLDPGLLILPAA